MLTRPRRVSEHRGELSISVIHATYCLLIFTIVKYIWIYGEIYSMRRFSTERDRKSLPLEPGVYIFFCEQSYFSSWLNFIALSVSNFFLKFLCFLLSHYCQVPYRSARPFSEVFLYLLSVLFFWIILPIAASFLKIICDIRDISWNSGSKLTYLTDIFFLDNSFENFSHLLLFLDYSLKSIVKCLPSQAFTALLWSVNVPYQNWGIFIFVVQ